MGPAVKNGGRRELIWKIALDFRNTAALQSSESATKLCKWGARRARIGKQTRWILAIGDRMPDEVEFLKRLYDRFNDRDMVELLAAMQEDVIWANGMEGGHVHGREGVRSYWTRQWAMIDPHVEPVEFSKGPQGEIIVVVHQIVRDLNGTLLTDKLVGHVFRLEKGLVQRFDIRST